MLAFACRRTHSEVPRSVSPIPASKGDGIGRVQSVRNWPGSRICGSSPPSPLQAGSGRTGLSPERGGGARTFGRHQRVGNFGDVARGSSCRRGGEIGVLAPSWTGRGSRSGPAEECLPLRTSVRRRGPWTGSRRADLPGAAIEETLRNDSVV